MVKNGVKTGKDAASLASKLLRKDETNKEVKKVSASDLSNAKKNTKQKKK